ERARGLRRRTRGRVPRARRRSGARRGRRTAMSSFVRAVGAEFRKVFSTRLWWVLGLILFGYVGISAAGIGWALTLTPDEAGPMPFDLAPLVYAMTTATGFVFPVIFGAMSITGEVRHRTL